MEKIRTWGFHILIGVFVGGCFFDTSGEPAEIIEELDSGLGTVCLDNTDCQELEYNICALDPTGSDNPGYCTLDDCTVEDCHGDYQCCNCLGIEMIDAAYCARQQDISVLVGVLGCTCQ